MNLAVAERPAFEITEGLSSPRWKNRCTELGLGILVIAVPLAFLPSSFSPFSDIKLFLVAAGTALLFAGRTQRSPLARAVIGWLLISACAAALGVDWWWSLLGRENAATGLVMLTLCGFILVAATEVPSNVRVRLPRWFVASAAASGSIAIAYRFAPSLFARVFPNWKFEGGTLGHPVFMSAFMAVGVAAAAGARTLRWRVLAPALIVMSTALSISTKRVGWVALVAALIVVLVRDKDQRKRSAIIAIVVASTLAMWWMMNTLVPTSTPLTGADRFSELGTDSGRARIMASHAMFRGWEKRPIFGWGPSNTWGAYLSSASPAEVAAAHRGMSDAHDIILETAVTTGVVGLAALALLVALTLRLIRRGPPSLGWAAGGAAALFAMHMLQPLNVALTPMMFLLAGLSCPAGTNGAVPHGKFGSRFGWLVIGACCFLATTSLVSSVFDQYGRTYGSTAALRASLALSPRRVTATEQLALDWAFDGRSNRDSAQRACSMALRLVDQHPWNPNARMWASDADVLLHDYSGATAWIRRQLEMFPNDDVARSHTPEGPVGASPPLVHCSSSDS
ncbi:MAG: O-antigen ligase family protein [Actinomycetota bacterium]